MFRTVINGYEMTFDSDERLFSPNGADRGTLAMLSHVALAPGQKVLDLGCGYGLVGIYAAKICGVENVLMSDLLFIATRSARENALRNGVGDVRIVQSDGFENITDTGFDLILSNPPYHADFSVAKHFIEKGFNRLRVGGRFYMVTKRLLWYKNKLTAIFGGVRVYETDGYFVFEAEKRDRKYANAEKKLKTKPAKDAPPRDRKPRKPARPSVGQAKAPVTHGLPTADVAQVYDSETPERSDP